MKILVTGATGYIGKHLVLTLQENGHDLTLLTRGKTFVSNCKEVITDFKTIPLDAFAHCDIVIHLAGLAHDMNGLANETMFNASNVTLTEQLLKASISAQVPTFLFMSTSKVYGDTSIETLQPDSPYKPEDLYSQSKVSAEKILKKHAKEISIVVLRPPVVYGSTPNGNILTLLNACNNKKTVPVSYTKNQRSFLFVDNLCSAINQIVNHPHNPGFNPYPIDDGDSISTEDFIRTIGQAVGSNARLIRIPKIVLKSIDFILLKIIGRKKLLPLYSNLELDSTSFQCTYNWKPPTNTKESISKAFRT